MLNAEHGRRLQVAGPSPSPRPSARRCRYASASWSIGTSTTSSLVGCAVLSDEQSAVERVTSVTTGTMKVANVRDHSLPRSCRQVDRKGVDRLCWRRPSMGSSASSVHGLSPRRPGRRHLGTLTASITQQRSAAGHE
jgi:hypothetical protein